MTASTLLATLCCLLGAVSTLKASEAKPCTFTPNCDFAHGSRDMAPAASKEECCSLCQARPDCAAGVLSGGDCWFKMAADISHGCQHSNRVQFACINDNTPSPPPGPPPPASCSTPACLALAKSYDTLKNDTCVKVLSHVPTLNAADVDSFMTLYKNYTGGGDEAPVLAAAHKVLAAADVQTFLSLPDSFTAGGLDAAMVQCALMTQATSIGLAEFAIAGQAEQALITKLLGDPLLMRDMLVAGGASSSEADKGHNTNGKRFAQAMAIYTKLLQASNDLAAAVAASHSYADAFWDDRSQANILKRLALGTALEHAVPIHFKYVSPPARSPA